MLRYFISFFVAIFMSSTSLAADLYILTYDGIASEWGVGPKWEEAFEKQCACDIEFVTVNGGSSSIITRAMIDSTAYDVILGIDNAMLDDTVAKSLLAPHHITLPQMAIDWKNDYAIAFDYGWLAFVGRKGEKLPSSMEELINSQDIKIIMETPQTSGFAHWLYGLYGDKSSDMWQKMKSHIVTLTPSWSEAYNLFLEGEADMVLSYTSSPAYHIEYDKTDQYIAPAFAEGNYLQIELASLAKTSQNPELARQFLRFLLTEEAQKAIPLTNIMFPSVKIKLPEAFDNLDIPQKSILPQFSNKKMYNIWSQQVEK